MPGQKRVLPRPLPVINEMNRHFWCGGANGRLHIQQCQRCRLYFHPYQAVCHQCGSRDIKVTPVSGLGTVVAVSVNYQPWFPDIPVPYILAVVELDEQADIRLVTNLNMPIDEAENGLRVRVCFEQHGDIFVPFFEAA